MAITRLGFTGPGTAYATFAPKGVTTQEGGGITGTSGSGGVQGAMDEEIEEG